MKRLAILDDYQGAALEMADWQPLEGDVDIRVLREHIADEGALVSEIGDCEILVIMRERTPFTRWLFEKLPNLEHLYTTGMRNNSIDPATAGDNGVLVTGHPTLNHPTPELTWGLIIALARSIPYEHDGMRNGEWQRTVGHDLKGATLGIIGLGRMGSQVARVAKAFDMNIVAWSSNLTQARCDEIGVELAVSKAALLRASDFVTIHLILGDRSRGTIGAQELQQIGSDCFLINTSRGPIVEEAALIDALRSRAIAGAGLDVYDTEPLPADHPLRTFDNVVLLPHLGYVSRNNYRGLYGGAVANIRAWLDGDVINEVTPVTKP